MKIQTYSQHFSANHNCLSNRFAYMKVSILNSFVALMIVKNRKQTSKNQISLKNKGIIVRILLSSFIL